MASFGFKVEGGRELAEALRALGREMREEVLLDALEAGAELLADEMRQLVPIGDDPPHLADNISVGRPPESDRRTGEVALAVGPRRKFFYAGFLEFGTVKMRARPFMRPAFDSRADAALRVILNQLWGAVRATTPSASFRGL